MKKILIPLLSISLLYACSGNQGGTDKKAELDKLKKEQMEIKEKISKIEAELAVGDTTESKSKLVAITEMVPQAFNHFIEVQAKVKGDEDLIISAESMGNITQVFAEAGDKVTRGQVLATIDDRVIRQGIAELQAQLDLATQLFEKQQNLWNQKIGSEVQFLQAKTNKESLEKRMASLNEQLDMTRIKSPINGTVDEVVVKTGQAVAPGAPAFRVVNLTDMKVVAEIAESFISKVKKGDKVILEFPDMGKRIETRLDYSGQAINSLNRTFNVEVRLKPEEGVFHPNMVAVMKILDYSSPEAFSIPENAVQKSSDGEFVYIAEQANGKTVARRKVVTTGIIYNGTTEIKSGLAEGDKVITLGFQNVIDGDEIRF